MAQVRFTIPDDHCPTYIGHGLTPVGPAWVAWSGTVIHQLTFDRAAPVSGSRQDTAAQAWLDAICTGTQPLTVAPTGTAFQLTVWKALTRIPRGATSTYAALAQAIGRPTAQRAVGNACGANPIAILIPCHRILRSDGGLGGYSGGIAWKRQLLAWEGVAESGLSTNAWKGTGPRCAPGQGKQDW